MISDQSVRTAIRNENTRSVVVEASAGTGKTTLITDRVSALVKSGIPLENLAVVTFTEAAACELRSRIREILPPEHRRTMDQAWITTIHGFASRILREYFHLCGGVPEFTMETDHFSRSELGIQWDIYLADAESSALRASSESLKNPGSSELLFIAAEIEKHRWFTDSAPLGNTDKELAVSIALWEKTFESLIPLCTAKSDALLSRIQIALDSLASGIPVKVNLTSVSAANWGGKESLASVKEVLKEYNTNGLKHIASLTQMLGLLPAFSELVIPFAVKMRSIWDENPTRMSFDDLLYKAWLAVSRSAELRRELNGRFSHIFIDEFQDTSLIQVRLFSTLLEQSGLAAKLTVVGDPKQSIFGWRAADIETYKDTVGKLEKSNALSETITVNFRSDTSIIDFVNSFGEALFSQISPEEEPFSCGYSPITPRPDAPHGQAVTVHRLPELKASEMADVQARRIADLIDEPSHTAVLFRTGTHLDVLVQELDRRGIPYKVEASRDFHKRKEVEDTAGLIKAVLCPSDEYALARTFRSIYFGISDRDITLWRLKRTPDTIKAAEELLCRLRQVAFTLPPGLFMETLFRNTCLLTSVRESGYQVARRLGNLRFILETAHKTDDYAVLIETLQGEAPMSAEEPSAPPENLFGAVTLSTIHRAKGLAWKHVILANPGNSSNTASSSVLINPRDLTAGISTAGGTTANYEKLFRREKNRSIAEYRRLLYVAVTRPKQKLDIFLPEKTSEGSPAGILNAALRAAQGYTVETVASVEESVKNAEQETLSAIPAIPDAFNCPYPCAIPAVQAEREKHMRLGTEVHSIMEFIDFQNPETWLCSNRDMLSTAMEFPEEAAALARNFFEVFNFDGAEIIGREYPLLVEGKQYYVDLLIRRNGILEAIDYKTDKDDPELKTLEYRDKQILYRNNLEKLTGAPVVAKLVFLQHAQIREI
jgi:ATP-dependent helicase/nuclease subunit A